MHAKCIQCIIFKAACYFSLVEIAAAVAAVLVQLRCSTVRENHTVSTKKWKHLD